MIYTVIRINSIDSIQVFMPSAFLQSLFSVINLHLVFKICYYDIYLLNCLVIEH